MHAEAWPCKRLRAWAQATPIGGIRRPCMCSAGCMPMGVGHHACMRDVAACRLTATQVENGKGAMPAWEGRLSEEEIQGVAAYVLKQVGTVVGASSQAGGRPLKAPSICDPAAAHGWEGSQCSSNGRQKGVLGAGGAVVTSSVPKLAGRFPCVQAEGSLW